MRYVIIRDDDTNALTPVACLERLYRPFLEKKLPVNLATIPEVTLGAKMKEGAPEGFLYGDNGNAGGTLPIASNERLVRYLLANHGFKIVQHGCHHDYLEFERASGTRAGGLLDHGTARLLEAGFPKPETFVAPYDKLSPPTYAEVAERFRIISTGWFELKRLPFSWWPPYLLKKVRNAPHWRIGDTLLLSHPGCLLSSHRSYNTMLDRVVQAVNSSKLTVLVTHWWEYFPKGKPDDLFIRALHHTANYLANNREINVIAFSDLLNLKSALN